MSGVPRRAITSLAFTEPRAANLLREYQAEAIARFGPFVSGLTRPLWSALAAGTVEGFVAREGRRTSGLACYVRYGPLARLTFLHVAGWARGLGVEEDLAAACADALRTGPRPVERIVSEAMVVSHDSPDQIFADLGFAVVERQIMRAALAGPGVREPRLRTFPLRDGRLCEIRSWDKGDALGCAEVLREANLETVDGLIYPELLNERQVRAAVSGITRGSCGPFDAAASVTAVAPDTGEIVGVSLCCRSPGRTGFVAELAVGTAWQGQGLGAALLERSVRQMRAGRLNAAYLGVTCANTRAVGLYLSRGFASVSSFGSYYWPK